MATLQGQTGKDALRTAKKVIRSEGKIERMKTSAYAKPATLEYQVRRSLLCVFTGLHRWFGHRNPHRYPVWLVQDFHGCHDTLHCGV